MSTVVHSTPSLFIRDSDIGIPSITPFEVCNAVVKASSASKVEGVQKINNLWRLYFKDRAILVRECEEDHLDHLRSVTN